MFVVGDLKVFNQKLTPILDAGCSILDELQSTTLSRIQYLIIAVQQMDSVILVVNGEPAGLIIMRIEQHPILGTFEKGSSVQFSFDGQTLEGFEGEPIAIALRSNGVLIHRYTSRRNEPRGMFCAIGRCTDCIMVVDGKPNIRTCVEPLKAEMVVETQRGKGPEK